MNFTERPFGVPKSVSDSAKINEILEKSFAYQKMFGVSNACGFVTIILKHCFAAAGISMNLVYGTYEVMGVCAPHMWLDVQGHIVDNTYVEDIPEEVFNNFKTKMAKYSATLDDDTSLFLGDEYTNAIGLDNHSIKGFKWYLQNQDKVLLMHKNKISLRSYYQSLVKLMKEEYDIVVPDIPNNKCWSCDAEGPEGLELKKCTRCKFALYCNRKCQEKDWKRIHKELCLPSNTP